MVPPPELEYAPGAYRAAKGSEEHRDLDARAREGGEFVIMAVQGSQEELFVPLDMSQTLASGAYAVELGTVVMANTEFKPGVPRPE